MDSSEGRITCISAISKQCYYLFGATDDESAVCLKASHDLEVLYNHIQILVGKTGVRFISPKIFDANTTVEELLEENEVPLFFIKLT